MLVKPSSSKHKVTLNSGRLSYKGVSGHEIVSIVITGGSGGAAVRVSEGPTSNPNDSILLSANAGESSVFAPTQPTPFKTGFFAELEQSSGNAEATITFN